MSATDSAHDRRQRRSLVGLALLFFAPLAVAFYLYYGSGGWSPVKRVNRGDLIEPPRPLPELSLPLAVPAAAARAANADTANVTAAGAGATDTATAVGNAGSTGAPAAAANTAAATTRAAGRTKPDFLKSKWTLLYFGSGSCSARCRSNLYNTRQVRIALDRDMERVQRVFIADGECCDWPFLAAQHPDLIVVRATPDAAPLVTSLPAFNDIPPAAADRVYLIDPLGNLMMSYAPAAKPKGMLQDLKRLLGLSSVG